MDGFSEDFFLKLNKKTQIYIIKEASGQTNFPDKKLLEKLDIEVLVEFFEFFCEKNEKKIIENSENYYRGLQVVFGNREEQAFKNLSFQLQIKILQDAPKDKKL